MGKDYDFNNKESTERFRCPYCNFTFKQPKILVIYYYYRGKSMTLRCPCCGNKWYVDLMIKRFYQFDEYLNKKVEVDAGVFKRP